MRERRKRIEKVECMLVAVWLGWGDERVRGVMRTKAWAWGRT